MKYLLTPKLDLVFKMLFAGNAEILTDLLNSVLGLSADRRIRSVEVKNPTIRSEEITGKFIVLDILAIDESGRRYEIEMQVREYDSYPKRALYYVSRVYADQLDSGENYEKLKPVIGIHFLDYEMFSDYDDFHFRFEMRDVRHPELLFSDDLSLHILELPKFEKKMKSVWFGNSLTEWLHFINHAHEEDKAMRTAYRNPVIGKAFDILETLSADENARQLARIREDALRLERSELSAAERKGEKRGELIGSIHTTQRFLKRPLTPKEYLVGQSIEELRAILKILEADLKV